MNKKIKIIIAMVFVLVLLLLGFLYSRNRALVTNTGNEPAKLAIIIDDFGSSREGVIEMMEIDRHLTFAIMPFMDHTKEDLASAIANNHEVIAHLAMEPERGKKSWLGPKPIMCSMPSEDVRKIVESAMEELTFAKGANIHMGSKASCEDMIMRTVLQVMKEKNLYFVDSRTGRKPVAKKIAEEIGVNCLENNIFLDGQKPKSHIMKKIKAAAETAKKKGHCIAIGHVGIEGGVPMAEAIKESYAMLDEMNVELVYVSELLEGIMIKEEVNNSDTDNEKLGG